MFSNFQLGKPKNVKHTLESCGNEQNEQRILIVACYHWIVSHPWNLKKLSFSSAQGHLSEQRHKGWINYLAKWLPIGDNKLDYIRYNQGLLLYFR